MLVLLGGKVTSIQARNGDEIVRRRGHVYALPVRVGLLAALSVKSVTKRSTARKISLSGKKIMSARPPRVASALWLLVGQCSALAPLPVLARPTASMLRAAALQMDAAQQKEIEALKSKLKAAEATISKLSASNLQPPNADAGEQATDAFQNSRFPLYRKLQRSVTNSLGGLTHSKTEQDNPSSASEYLAATKQTVDQLFSKYDADRSGLLDIDEFRTMVSELKLPGAKSAEAFASDLAQGTAKSAESLVADTARSADDFAKSVSRSVNDIAKGVNDLAASAGVPGATASVPVTLVGGCGSGYKEMLSLVASGKDVPVEPLILAVERQATLTTQLGGFMQLIVKLDESNMRTVRESWTKHGRPASLRELLEAEVADGVVEPTRLKEGSAALSLLWSMRAKRFWTTVADGFADQVPLPPSTHHCSHHMP